MKRCLIMLLIICILTTVFVPITVDAVSYTNQDVFGFLKALGIFSQVQESKKDAEISRIEFAVFAARMIGIDEQELPIEDYFYDIPSDHWGKSSVNALVERSVIFGDGQKNFRPDDIITLPEAIVILTRIMRLEHEAVSYGGYPSGYIKTATKYDIISPTMSVENRLTYKDTAELIYNALNAKIEYMGSVGTLLSIYHDVHYGEGRINAVHGASINEEMVTENECVSIDGKVLVNKSGWLYDRLGLYVKYYYRTSKGIDEIVYVSKDNDARNEIVEITADNYNGYNDGKIEYYQNNSSGRVKKADVSDGIVVLRNGQNVSDNLKNGFADFYGTMRLIKIKGHAEFDVAIVEDYKNIVVGHINAVDKIVYDSNDPSVSIDLSGRNDELISYLEADGNESSFDKISIGDVISVAQSDDKSFTKLVINAKVVSGTIEGTKASDDSIIVKIDGNEYEFESRFYQQEKPEIVIGATVTAKTDLFDKIVSFEVGKSQDFKYAYIINALIDDKMKCVLIKMYTEDSEMLIGECATKVKIDSVRYTDNETVIKALSSGGEVKSQLVRFKRNSKNKIVEIDTKETGIDESNLSLHLMKNEKNIYRHWTNLLGYNAYVPTTVKVMVIPEEGTEKIASDKQFQMKNITAIPSGKTSRVDVYQIDEDSLNVDFVVYYTTMQSKIDTYALLQVVEEVSEGLSQDGDLTTMLKLDSSGNSITYAVSPYYVSTGDAYSNLDLSLIGEGDIIRIATDYKNEIMSIQLILDYSKAKEDGNMNFFDNSLNPGYKVVNGVPVGNFFDGFKISYGYASRTEGNLVQWGYDKPGDADEIYNVTFDSNKAKILIYDETDKEDPCKLGTIKDIVGYYTSSENFSKLISISRSAIISNMVVYK